MKGATKTATSLGGGFAMGAIQSPAPDFACQNDLRSEGIADASEVWQELEALLEKGEQLGELVTRLSKLVAGNSAELS
jgi:hypothetical protein